MTPAVSVVFATRDRPQRLDALLDSLRAQTLSDFEVIAVDDGSGPETARVLDAQLRRNGMPLKVIRRDSPGGPAAARNAGWRAARAPLVAFIDDDCVATPGWLAAGLETVGGRDDVFAQGPTRPIPEEWPRYGPFSHTMDVRSLGPGFETANIFYPRALLERLGGFDEVAHRRAGEDTDLAWKAIERHGVTPVWAPDALVHHAVLDIGPLGKLRRATIWHEAMRPFREYRGLRRHRYSGFFWSEVHAWLFRAALALVLPRRLWWLRCWLAAPYLDRLLNRRSGPLLAPYLIAHDLLEVATCARGAWRYRTLVL